MAITPLPSPPLITDAPDVFDTKASAHVASLSTFVTEMNAAIAAVNMTKWISGTTYAIGDVTWSPITFYAYRRKTAGAGTTDPSADATNWISIASAASGANTDITSMSGLTTPVIGLKSNGSASYTASATLTTADLGRAAYYNSASAGTLTLPDTTGMPIGSLILLSNIGAGVLTVARSGTVTIFAQGLSNVTAIDLFQSDWVILQYEGNWVQVAGARYIPSNATNAAQLGGVAAASYLYSGGNGFAPGGLVEVGRVFDFHGGQAAATDYDVRFDVTGNGAAGQGTLNIISSNLVNTGNITAYSDERLKSNWANLADDFIQRLSGVKHGTYDRIDIEQRQIGVSAQSLREVMPEAVVEQNDKLSVAYGNAALAACVELAKEVVVLRARIARLEASK